MARNVEEIFDQGPIVKLVNNIMAEAVARNASDIHLEPQEEGIRVRYRIDGLLQERPAYSKAFKGSLVSRIKIMANLNIAERRLPQDGRCQLKVDGRIVDFRVSVLPTIDGEKIVLRVLDQGRLLLDINQLGLENHNWLKFERLLKISQGMILLTGPTGCGKTTTLYAMLKELNTPDKNITTIEDPVEYRLPGVNQVQINPKAGFAFANGLRAFLRQDPNVIMVGEIRDGETAAIAIRAALTGHLVLSTLHTNGAPEALTRLLDMGIEPYQVASSIAGVIAQRLVRTLCIHCGGTGCLNCEGSGFLGRTAVYEIMPMNNPLRQWILGKGAGGDLRAAALRQGLITLRDDGLAKVKKGLTSLEELTRVMAIIEEG